MYVAVLIAHSWIRWAVLVLGTATLAVSLRRWRAGRGWGDGARRLHSAFLGVLDLQLLLGLALYVLLSPLPRTGLSDLGATMGDGLLRFYTVEHPFGMIVAIGAAHVGLSRARAADAGAAARIVAVAQAVWLVVTLLSIPWPIAAYGRPLFRF